MAANILNVVALDDDETILDMMVSSLEKAGYQTLGFNNGNALWEHLDQLKKDEPDVIILDKIIPQSSGVEILKKIKQSPTLQNVPVIVQSGDVEVEAMQESIDAGAYYYLTKPYEQQAMVALVKAAARDSVNRRKMSHDFESYQAALLHLKKAVFQVKTPHQALKVASLIASLAQNAQETSLLLSELILNAIEHGNLAIGYHKKAELLQAGRFDAEVQQRLADDAYRSRRVRISYTRSDKHVRVKISDEGLGFDWREYVNVTADRFVDLNGRGIAYSKILGINLDYSEDGSHVEFTFDARKAGN